MKHHYGIFFLALALSLPASAMISWEKSGEAFKNSAPPAFSSKTDTRETSWKRHVGAVVSGNFVIEQPYLNFRIAGGYYPFRAAITLWVDGKAVRSSSGMGSDELVATTWDLRPFLGENAYIGIYDHCIEDPCGYIIVDELAFSATPAVPPSGDEIEASLAAVRRQAVSAVRRNVPLAAADPWRPVYHYTPPAQRMNDPNGPGWNGGYYHVFYQHMVFVGSGPATNVHWGHARSKDLVNWETLPFALYPEYHLGELSIFSGNLGYDFLNKPVQFTTAVFYTKNSPRRIWLARPADDTWLHWNRTPASPPGLEPTSAPGNDIKDPFPFSIGKRRFVVVTDKTIPVYEAIKPDLSEWKAIGNIDPGSAECPNFFELDGRYVYLASPHTPPRYHIGDFDSNTGRFSPQAEGYLNHSGGFYATTAYKAPSGRMILHGITRGQKPGRGWTGALALPRILSIGPDGHPRQHPIPELKQLRHSPARIAKPITLKNDSRIIPALKGDVMEIIAKFKNVDAGKFGLRIRRSDDGRRFIPVYWAEGQLIVDKADSKLPPCTYELDPETREITLHLFLDKGILDVATADGKRFESRIHYAPLEDLGVEIFSEGGTAILQSLDAWQLHPANIDHSQFYNTGY